MTKPDQIKFFEEFSKKQLAILLKKGDDYAGEDRLSNFKLVGAVCRISPEVQCLSMIATKATRLGELLSGKTPQNESIDDSVIDLANFSVLLAMILNENRNDLGDNDRKDEGRVACESSDGSLWPIIYPGMDGS